VQTADPEHRTKVATAGTKVQKHSWVVPLGQQNRQACYVIELKVWIPHPARLSAHLFRDNPQGLPLPLGRLRKGAGALES